MASNVSSKTFRLAIGSFKQRPSSSNPRIRPSSTSFQCQTPCFSTSTRRKQESDANSSINAPPQPRWKSTPRAMVAPIPLRDRQPFPVNNNPAALDEVYNRLLGPGGDKMLSEEVKWLAVTHKSFDHGRRGFNDRLAFFGRRIVELQVSLAIIQSANKTAPTTFQDPHHRKSFEHPALAGLTNLTEEARDMATSKDRLARLADQHGLGSVIRWKPKHNRSLARSGIDVVMAQSLYAIVGAIALERGGEVAIRTVQERILKPLGFI
ncbi:MAG: hypothetical protein M1834_005163 [Cirrosporium novae-zelandiae]|nr:MAG: hypothetical protein M1834_005163 [Cirrosporium novae-zelandiae]